MKTSETKLTKEMLIETIRKNVKDGWHITANEKKLNGIIKGLIRCDGECPCANTGETLLDRMCPCTNYRENDHCCCGLYEMDYDALKAKYDEVKASLDDTNDFCRDQRQKRFHLEWLLRYTLQAIQDFNLRPWYKRIFCSKHTCANYVISEIKRRSTVEELNTLSYYYDRFDMGDELFDYVSKVLEDNTKAHE